jgi:hypothetical protein
VVSPKLTKEQHQKQLAGIAAELERRKEQGNAGKQITAKGFLKREQKAALEIISKTNKGIPKPMPEGYVHPTKTELDNAWKIVNAVRDYDKHDVALKIAKLAAQKAEHEAKTAGYGDKSPEKVKEEFEQKGLRPVGGFEYKAEWDEDIEEFEAEEDSDE